MVGLKLRACGLIKSVVPWEIHVLQSVTFEEASVRGIMVEGEPLLPMWFSLLVY